MPDEHDPITQMAADPDFAKLSLVQQRQALAAHDPIFGNLNDEQLTRFVKTHQGAPLESFGPAQAHAEMQRAIPTMEALELPSGVGTGTGTTKTLSPFTAAGQRKAALGERYNDYEKQSAVFAGTSAGAMLTSGATLPMRMATTGAGTGVGALAGGATPEEALQTGITGAVAQPIAEGLTAGGSALIKKFFGPKEIPITPITEEWRKINDAIGVRANAIRIGENATDLSQAATMPGRALAKVGLTSEQLSKMTPLEQQAAIAPIRQRAASDLNHAFQEATDQGITFDVGKSVTDLIRNRIKGPAQQKAIDAFNQLVEEAQIANQRATTPLEARELRQMLSYGARFGQGGDLSSLAAIRAELYRAVNRDLHGAVPGLQDLDQFFSDVKAAGTATRNSVAKMATKAPEPLPPTFMERTLDTAKREALPWAIRGAIGGGAYGVLRKLTGMMSEMGGNPTQ